jgi:hypothetical protein
MNNYEDKLDNTPECDEEECCCRCKNQVLIVCHPWNKTIGKGGMGDLLGWGCSAFDDEEYRDVVIFSETKHGMCEMYTKLENKITQTT